MRKPQLKWGSPKKDDAGDMVRTSKCGRYAVLTLAGFAGAPSGFRMYELRRGGARLGSLHNSLGFALMAAEYDNDPRWRP